MVSMGHMEKESRMDVSSQMNLEIVTLVVLMVEFITGLEMSFKNNISHIREKDSFQP